MSNPIQGLQHDDRVASDHDHSDLGGDERKIIFARMHVAWTEGDSAKITYLLLFPGLLLLDGLIDDEIHERIVAAQNTRQLASSIDLERQPDKEENIGLDLRGTGYD